MLTSKVVVKMAKLIMLVVIAVFSMSFLCAFSGRWTLARAPYVVSVFARALVDGAITDKEWDRSASVALPNGTLLVENDARNLYLLVDLTGDTHDDPPLASDPWGDFFFLSFDVDLDGSITPNVDVNYVLTLGTYNVSRQFYMGPDSWTTLRPTSSRVAASFSSSPNFSTPHRIWELAVNLTEINAVQNGLVRIGLRTYSQIPSFDTEVPGNFTRDFSNLIEVAIAPVSRSSVFSALYLYSYDVASASSFSSLLVSYGVSVDLVNSSEALAWDFNPYDLVVVGNDTGYQNLWEPSAVVAAVNKTGKPVLGVGEGGYAFLGKLGLSVGYPHGSHASASGFSAVDGTHLVFNSPIRTGVQSGGTVQVYDSSVGLVDILMLTLESNVTALGRDMSQSGYYSLIVKSNYFALWGFNGSPQLMTQAGRDVFVNLVFWLVGWQSPIGGYSAAFVYFSDVDAASSFASLLTDYNMTVALVPRASAATWDYTRYGVIIVGNDTGSLGDWVPESTVTALFNTLKPVLAVGEGGYALFGKLGLAVGYPWGIHGDENALAFAGTEHQILHFPNAIDISGNGTLRVYSSASSVGIFLSSPVAGVTVIGTDADLPGYAGLVQQGRFVLWGFADSPVNMTEAGKKLFVNVVVWLQGGILPEFPSPVPAMLLLMFALSCMLVKRARRLRH